MRTSRGETEQTSGSEHAHNHMLTGYRCWHHTPPSLDRITRSPGCATTSLPTYSIPRAGGVSPHLCSCCFTAPLASHAGLPARWERVLFPPHYGPKAVASSAAVAEENLEKPKALWPTGESSCVEDPTRTRRWPISWDSWCGAVRTRHPMPCLALPLTTPLVWSGGGAALTCLPHAHTCSPAGDGGPPRTRRPDGARAGRCGRCGKAEQRAPSPGPRRAGGAELLRGVVRAADFALFL